MIPSDDVPSMLLISDRCPYDGSWAGVRFFECPSGNHPVDAYEDEGVDLGYDVVRGEETPALPDEALGDALGLGMITLRPIDRGVDSGRIYESPAIMPHD